MSVDHHLTASASRQFPPSPGSVTSARRFVRGVLEGAGIDGTLLDSAELVTSELAANAVLHARTDYQVGIDVGDRVQINVTDASPSMPVMRELDVHALGGRGLYLVDQLSASWGADRGAPGKCVWSVLDADSSQWWSSPRR